MKAASISDLKKELGELSNTKLQELVIRLTKYKKENKELLTYLLFESGDETAYIASIKEEIDALFKEVNKSNLYLAKKTLRKILRMANKFIKYSGNKQTEVEVLVYYSQKLKSCGIPIRKNTMILNLYERQLLKIYKAILLLHEDLQYDYEKPMNELENF